MTYEIREIDGGLNRNIIEYFNTLDPQFPDLQDRHFDAGFWWLALRTDHPDALGEVEAAVGFAGLVPFEPFAKIGYYKRCFVLPDHHGHGLQYRFMMAREAKAKSLGWDVVVSECGGDNTHSASNFRKAGFDRCEPEQRWGASGSIYWMKAL